MLNSMYSVYNKNNLNKSGVINALINNKFNPGVMTMEQNSYNYFDLEHIRNEQSPLSESNLYSGNTTLGLEDNKRYKGNMPPNLTN